MARFISLVSSKGGVGKTTCAVNLGNALRLLGKNTVVVDACAHSPHVHTHLGALNLGGMFTLKEALDLRIHPYHAVHRHNCGLNVLMNRPFSTLNKHQALVPVLSQLHEYFDYVIVDTSGGFSPDMLEASRLGESYIVTTPDTVSVTEAIKTKNAIEHAGGKAHGVIVNKYHGMGHAMRHHDIQNLIDAPIVGTIAYDDAVLHAANLRQPVHLTHPDSDAAKHFLSLANNIIGE